MDYNSYYTNTTNHPEKQNEYKDPNQLEPKKAARGYLFILIIAAVILGLWFLNENLGEDDNQDNSNSEVTSNVDSNQ